MKKLFYLPIALLSFFSNSQGIDASDSGSAVSSDLDSQVDGERSREPSDQEDKRIDLSDRYISPDYMASLYPGTFFGVSKEIKKLKNLVSPEKEEIDFSRNYLTMDEVKFILRFINYNEDFHKIQTLKFCSNCADWENPSLEFEIELRKFLNKNVNRRVDISRNSYRDFENWVACLNHELADRIIYKAR